MKKILLVCLLITACEIYTPSGHVVVGPYVETHEVCTYDDYTPYYYEDAWMCWDNCCTWAFDYPYYYKTCEETWCYYDAYCGWNLVDEYCY